jgi:dihydroorotate dehydrogenase (fumarate)
MADITTNYMGFQLKGPLVASSSPLTGTLDGLLRLEDAGASAVVLPSLFQEQISLEVRTLDRRESRKHTFYEAASYFPDMRPYNEGPEAYLELVRRARGRLSIPVIASLNGLSPGDWTRYARRLEEAGADGIEVNSYFLPADPEMTGEEVEGMYIDLVRGVKASVNIPVAAKLCPFFSSLPNLAKRLDEAGANALVLFNRFYQPDIDLEKLDAKTDLELSESGELRLRLRWVSLLYGKVRPDLAITGGVHTAEDVLKCMLAGARAAMVASVLLERGPEHLAQILRKVSAWMDKRGFESISRLQGCVSHRATAEPAALERAAYMKVLSSYRKKAQK